MIYHLVWGSFSYLRKGMPISTLMRGYLNLDQDSKDLIDGKRKIYWHKGDEDFLKRIQDPEKSDTFIFILVKREGHPETFEEWVKEKDLEDCVSYRGPLVTNPVHTNNGRQLQLVIMQSKNHFQKELIK